MDLAEELDSEEDLVDLEDLNEVWNEEWTQLRNKLRAREFIEESPNFIRTKDGYRITYVLVS